MSTLIHSVGSCPPNWQPVNTPPLAVLCSGEFLAPQTQEPIKAQRQVIQSRANLSAVHQPSAADLALHLPLLLILFFNFFSLFPSFCLRTPKDCWCFHLNFILSIFSIHLELHIFLNLFMTLTLLYPCTSFFFYLLYTLCLHLFALPICAVEWMTLS